MRQAARTIDLPLDRTWKGHVPACAELSDVVSETRTVHTLRVKLVGTPRAPEAVASSSQDLSTTQRFARTPSDVPRRATGADDALQQALAFARTIPALTPEQLGFKSSGVREIERLELWLEPRDRAGIAADSCDSRSRSSTLRLSANPLTRAWQLWYQLPAALVLCAAATLCVLSALALGLLSN